jgi:hypothetical protein
VSYSQRCRIFTNVLNIYSIRSDFWQYSPFHPLLTNLELLFYLLRELLRLGVDNRTRNTFDFRKYFSTSSFWNLWASSNPQTVEFVPKYSNSRFDFSSRLVSEYYQLLWLSVFWDMFNSFSLQFDSCFSAVYHSYVLLNIDLLSSNCPHVF